MSPLSHCRVPCLSTDSSPHASPAGTPLVSSTRAAGFSGSDWLGLAVEQLLHFRQSSILNQGAAEQSGAHGFFCVCRLAAFQGSWERLAGRSAALHLYSDYHPHGITTGWSNSMSTLHGTISLPLPTSFWRGKQGKVSRKYPLEMTSL